MTKLRPLLRYLAALAITALAVLLCQQCLAIWRTGSYTAENVADGLRILLLPAVLCAVAVVLAALGRAGLPEKTLYTKLTPENRLRLMKARLARLPEAARREARLRRGIRLALAAVVLLCAGMSLAFLLDGRNFVSWELEGVLAAMLLRVGPWTALALAALWGCEALCDRSCLRECEALRGLPREEKAQRAEKASYIGVVRVLLYAAAVVFIVLGVMNGGVYDVLVKAINICTECIGLG